MSTRNQVEILFHIAALALVEWALFEVFRTSVRAAGKYRIVLAMILIAIMWGGPLIFIFVHTRFTLWAYFAFITLLACLLAGFTYISGH